MAGWLGETTILSNRPGSATPQLRRESRYSQTTPAERAIASGLRAKARTVLREPASMEIAAAPGRQGSRAARDRIGSGICSGENRERSVKGSVLNGA